MVFAGCCVHSSSSHMIHVLSFKLRKSVVEFREIITVVRQLPFIFFKSLSSL